MWPFKKKEKPAESMDCLAQFSSNLHQTLALAHGHVLQLTFTINDLDEEIQRLLDERQKLVMERLTLNLIMNKQREAFGLPAIDLEEVDESEPDASSSAVEQ